MLRAMAFVRLTLKLLPSFFKVSSSEFATQDGRRPTDRPPAGHGKLRELAMMSCLCVRLAALAQRSRQSIVVGQAWHEVLKLVGACWQHEPDMHQPSNLQALKCSMHSV